MMMYGTMNVKVLNYYWALRAKWWTSAEGNSWTLTDTTTGRSESSGRRERAAQTHHSFFTLCDPFERLSSSTTDCHITMTPIKQSSCVTDCHITLTPIRHSVCLYYRLSHNLIPMRQYSCSTDCHIILTPIRQHSCTTECHITLTPTRQYSCTTDCHITMNSIKYFLCITDCHITVTPIR
jgi:hypothetical protein